MPKWEIDTLDKNLADVDPDSVSSMYDPAIGLPPKGPYLCAVRWLKVGKTGENSNAPGSAKVVIKAEISEPPGTMKSKYNGYELFKHQNVALESEAGRVNQLLLALLDNTKLTAAKKKAVLQAFHARQVVVDDKENITKIGTWTVPEGMKIGIVTRPDTDQNGDKSVGVGSFLPPSQAPKGIPADEAEEEAEEDVEPAEEGDEDEEVAARQEELEGYTLAKLKTLAKSLELTVKRGAKEEDLIDAILDAEFPPEDDEPEEEAEESEEDESEEEDDDTEEEAEEEEGDALDEMQRAALRVEAKALEVRVLKSMSDDDLRDALRAAGWEGEPAEEAEEEEEDDEPEPPAKPARRGAAKAAPKGRAAEKRRKGSGDDEPPF